MNRLKTGTVERGPGSWICYSRVLGDAHEHIDVCRCRRLCVIYGLRTRKCCVCHGKKDRCRICATREQA